MNVAVAERAPTVAAELRFQLDSMEGQFKAALPAHIPAERFARVVMTAVQGNPDLMKCDRRSLWGAAMKAAQDGLLPDGREGAIVAYKSTAQWMPMIAGLRKKVRNSGEIATWDAQVVHANDHFEFELGDHPFIRHKPALDDPGPVIAAYSIATLKGGEQSREVMSIAAIEAVRKRSKASGNGPWITDYEEMCRKTVARRHSKVLPMSTDLDDLIRRDDDLYDMEGAREEANRQLHGGKPQGLAGALDRLAAAPPAPKAAAADAVVERDVIDLSAERGEQDSGAANPTAPDNAEVPTPSASAGPAGDEPAKPAASDEGTARTDAAGGGEPVGEVLEPLDIARRRAAENYRRGMNRKAVPTEYRAEARQAERDAYLAEFDRLAAEKAEG